MYTTIFQTVAALTHWIFSGFKGRPDDYFDETNEVKQATMGLVYFIVVTFVVVLLMRLL